MKATEGENIGKVYKYQGIQILRAIACCFVVLCHTNLKCKGAFGVDIFMIITGFMLVHSTEKSCDNFMKKRIFRILPMYWFMTIVTSIFVCVLPSLFHSYEFSWSYLIKSLFFIPYEHNGIRQPIYGLGWTLNYEMFIYIIFFLALKISKKYRAVISSAICIALVLISNLFFKQNFIMNYYGSTIILEFVFGMAVWYLLKYIESKCKKMNVYIQTLCFWVSMITIGLLWIFQDNSCRGVISGGLTVLLFFSFFLWSYDKKFENNILVHIGNSSYCIYLTHIYVVRISERFFSFMPSILVATISITLSCLVGILWNSCIERKVQNALRKI